MGKIKKLLESELIGGTGNIDVYPVTSTKAVYDGNNKSLDDILEEAYKNFNELNISILYPTNGEEGTDRYTLNGAIAQVPSKYRKVGLKVSFVNEKNIIESWEYSGSSWTSSNFKEVGGKKIEEISTLTGNLKLIDYGVLTAGVITNNGDIKTDEWAASYKYSSKIPLKKGDVIVINLTSTPSYAALSRYNELDGSYTPLIVGNVTPVLYTVPEDMIGVFSGTLQSKNNKSYFLLSSLLRTAIKTESGVLNRRIEQLSSKIDANKKLFSGYARNTESVYSYTRNITLDNFELVKGNSFIVTMEHELYKGYTDMENNSDGKEVKFNVNNTGWVDVYYNGVKASAFNNWKAGELLNVYYDGNKYVATSLYGVDIDTLKWLQSQDITYESLYYNGVETGNYIQSYNYFLTNVKRNDFLFIRTNSTANIPLISKVEEDGSYTELLKGSSTNNYLFLVKEDMKIRIIYKSSRIPIVYRINSKLTELLNNSDTNITQLTSEIKKKASITDLINKANISDVEAERTSREEADRALEEKINDIGATFEGNIAEIVKQWLEDNPDATTTVTDGSISEVKLSTSLRTKTSYSYNTVADMKADTTLDVGMTVITKGYWELNDGGDGTYNIISSGIENGGDIIKLNNGKYAELVYDKRTFRLKQWGIDGKATIKRAKDIYPFLTNKDLTDINPLFDSSTTAETYIIQYLLNKKQSVNSRIILDGAVYYISHTLYPVSFATIEGLNEASRSSWINQAQLPQYLNGSPVHVYTKSLMIMTKSGIPMFASKKFVDPNEDSSTHNVVQLFKLKNLNASGTFSKKGFYTEEAGDFWNSSNLVMSKCEFENIGVSSFKNGFYIAEECDWCRWDKVFISNMKDNGLFLPLQGIIGNGQKNANVILNCEINAIGRDCDSEGNIINVYSASYDADNNPNVLPISKPDIYRGNAIVIGNSGNVIQNCDVSNAAVGVYRCSYSEGTVCSGLYSEGVSLAQVYDDYTEGNPNSAILGGYLREDTWKDSSGGVHTNIKHAKKGDFD